MPRRSKSTSRSKRRSRSGSRRKLSPAAKKWHAHLMKVYRSGKAKRASYTLRKAMKDAKKTYH